MGEVLTSYLLYTLSKDFLYRWFQRVHLTVELWKFQHNNCHKGPCMMYDMYSSPILKVEIHLIISHWTCLHLDSFPAISVSILSS